MNTLHIFLARNLLGIVRQIRYGEDQLADLYKIRYMTEQELERRLWRLQTYNENYQRAESIRKPLMKSKSTFKKRKSIFRHFGDNAASTVIFEQSEEEG